jgi:hypothetical protein
VRSEQSLVGREEAMRREPTEGRERKYLERIPMAIHDHRNAGCMLLESASFPARRWSVREGGSRHGELAVGAAGGS